MVLYQAIAWFARSPRSHALLRDAAERFGDHAGVRRGRRRPSPTPSCSTACATPPGATSRLGLEPGDRVCVWGPNSVDWVVAALAVSYAGGTLVPVNSRYTGHEVADVVDRTGATLVVVQDGFLGRTQIAELRAASDLASVKAVLDVRDLDKLDRRAVTAEDGRRGGGGGLPRRRGRHPVHVRHHRPLQGRDERAPADHRRRPGLGRARRRDRRRPLPRGQPVLPLLRLQGRHRGRAADRRDALPGADVRRRRDAWR